jgi:hypothetical protein
MMHGHPSYRGLRLDGPIKELHQAVDQLRCDTAPAPLDHQPASSPPAPPHRRRQDPGGGQAALVEEAS